MMRPSGILRVGLGAALFLLLVGACSQPEVGRGTAAPLPIPDAISAQAEILLPADASLADVYDRSCRSCHAYVDSGAPLTGHSAEWERRLEQGLDVLVEHTRTGVGSMPAMGMCLDCEAIVFEALILFMATAGGDAAEAG